ncbi:hypothetical protein ACIGBL_34560 [Streptomyces sp. NPDC085614]|uniref:hypothetical protein n=1 Tax=Streptomyces sp. NPDC085614 TaxID=3365733 RepID=UPI0037D6C437
MPKPVGDLLDEIRAELVTVEDPYFRGVDNLPNLPGGCRITLLRSTAPNGLHVCYFDHGRGWIHYSFVRRMIDPQIIVEEVFWQ